MLRYYINQIISRQSETLLAFFRDPQGVSRDRSPIAYFREAADGGANSLAIAQIAVSGIRPYELKENKVILQAAKHYQVS